MSLYGYRVTLRGATVWTSKDDCVDCCVGSCECVLEGMDFLKTCPPGATLVRGGGVALAHSPSRGGAADKRREKNQQAAWRSERGLPARRAA